MPSRFTLGFEIGINLRCEIAALFDRLGNRRLDLDGYGATRLRNMCSGEGVDLLRHRRVLRVHGQTKIKLATAALFE